MESKPGIESFDRRHAGERIREFRLQQNLSQAELAERSGVSITTVYKIETGAPVRFDLVQKVCKLGLDSNLDYFIRDRRKRESQPYVVVRSQDYRWSKEIDLRPRIPKDDGVLIQEPAERRRLGRLGFVNAFALNPHLIMAEGPGTLFFEVYARLQGPINSTIFRDCKIYVMSGDLRIDIAGEIIELGPQDMVGCAVNDVRWIEPLTPLREEDAAPVFLWLGAVRVGKPAKENGRTVIRKRSRTGPRNGTPSD